MDYNGKAKCKSEKERKNENILTRKYETGVTSLLIVYSLLIHMEWFVFIFYYKHTTSTNNANCYNFKTAELSVGKKCIIGSVYYAANTLQWRRTKISSEFTYDEQGNRKYS